MKFALALITIFSSTSLYAAEPSYCDPSTFAQRELRVDTSNLTRARVFKIGNLTLAGLGVGDSDSRYVERLALTYSRAGSSQKFCTWYLNKGNEAAQNAFNHRYVPIPSSDTKRTTKAYYDQLQTSFDGGVESFAACASDYGYIAVGCNGMKHRGPSVFAMVLAFSGCSAEHSVTIANKIWGSNGVSDESRIELANLAAKLAAARPDVQRKLQSLMTAN